MTIEDIIYDILEIKNATNDDHDISELWLAHKIGVYRSIFLTQDVSLTGKINPSMVQRLKKQKTVKVTSADDPSITVASEYLSKITIPSIVSLPDDMGLVRVSSSSNLLTFDIMDFDSMMLKIHFKEERMGAYGYCARIGCDLYAYPLTAELQALIVADDPMKIDGMTLETEYPIDPATAQKIVLEILTKDLNINMQSISDITNDSNHQLRILQSGNSKGQSTD